jgi:hypothetical protein
MGVSEMAARGEIELPGFPVSTPGAELGEAMSSIGPRAHKGAKRKGFRGEAWKDIKRMSGDNVREVGGYSNAVPGIGGLVGRSVSRQHGMRKSRGRVRT